MTFSPPRSAISAITQANPCVVTTSSVHLLATGNIVRLNVPRNYGMYPLNHKEFSVTVLSTTSFSIQFKQVPPALDVDSTEFPAFVIPSNPQFTAEVLCIGAGPTPITNTEWQARDNYCEDTLSAAEVNIATTNQPF